MAAIEATGVSKQYGTPVALDRIDLTVEEGETFGFLGPNGAGKSTFLNILRDFVDTSDGSVSIFGNDCQAAGVAARERIGVLTEGDSVYDRLTGRQHAEHAIRAKEADDDPIEILDHVGIRHAADRRAEASTGRWHSCCWARGSWFRWRSATGGSRSAIADRGRRSSVGCRGRSTIAVDPDRTEDKTL